ncbi:MAG: hypothetical protein H6828_13995 [Planctomycetes bacterium]|nr:hypothetical protein [Planctomycetota bacterium]
MKDLGTHVVLFLVISAAIVLMSAFFSETGDRAALRSFPKRLVYFLGGCALLTALMLAAEATLAGVS